MTLPGDVDLVVLDRAPLYLAGRIALRGRLLFDDDPPARVAWEADTRLQYLLGSAAVSGSGDANRGSELVVCRFGW